MKKNNSWSSRKRVFTTLNHQEPDRIPINFGGCAQTTLLECPPDKKAVTKLYEYLGIKNYDNPQIGAVANQVYNIDERVMKMFGSDFRLIMPNGGNVEILPDNTKRILGISCGLRVKKVGIYDDIFEFPLKDITDVEDIEKYQYWPKDEDYKNLAVGKLEEIKSLSSSLNAVLFKRTR